MLVQWRDDLSIGMLEIDVQHKLLFDKFNAFVNAYQSNQDTDEIMRMFWFLEAYAVTHFKEEEKLMQQVRFPDYAAHREKHLAFIDQINQLKERLKAEGLTQGVVNTMTTFITSWLIDHISTMDRAIGRFVINSAVPPGI
ncbi:hemerythrin family protein [Geomonas paludis]|uniref:Hemerythrin n=1 Tax=Geomonas paludis TaxID=2740185 RepID=A0A6V8MY49_9BACT|nr:hemerythrin family protein [Geomonas paludis]UPU37253.1 hemerythrin family protein [Geomonas paludis]GFO65148.1 hemerythrin [Geomonas paludis]